MLNMTNSLLLTQSTVGSEKPRSLRLALQTLGSEKTKKLYEYNIEKFRKFTGEKDLDSLVKLPQNQLETLVEDYLMDLKTKMNPNTIPVAMAPIKLLFVMNDVEINFNKIQKMYPAPIKKSGNKSYTREQLQQILRYATKKRARALILFLASTGCRIGVVEELKIRHMEKMTDGCYCISIHENDVEEYIVFLTPEAGKAMNEYLEERRKAGEYLDDDSPLFREEYKAGMLKARHMTRQSGQMLIDKCIKRAGIERKKIGKRYDIQLAHGMRKFYNTTIKMVPNLNYNVGEKLMGHKNGLDGVYFTPTKEQCFNEFKKSIPELTIDETERQKCTIQKLEAEKSDMEKKIPELVIQAVERVKEALRKEGHFVDLDKN